MKRIIHNLLACAISASLLGCGMGTGEIDTAKEGVFFFNDSTDILINYEGLAQFLDNNYSEPHYLSIDEMNVARDLIMSFMEPAKYQENQREAFIRKWGEPEGGKEVIADSREPLSFNMYYRQYAAYKNKEGEIMVYVSMTSKEFMNSIRYDEFNPNPYCLYDIQIINDGGENVIDVNINLSRKVIDYFLVHGCA